MAEKKNGAGGQTEEELAVQTEQQEQPVEQPVEQRSRRNMFRERFSSQHPDVDMDDAEAYYGALDDEYNSRDEELKRHRDDNERLNTMFMENPNAAYFMNDLLDGKEQMGVSLMRQFGETFKNAVDDPTDENVKAFADALDEHAARIRENDKLQDEFEKNADASEEIIDNWAKEHDAQPEQIEGMRDFINNQFTNLIVGRISPEMLDFAYKSLNYDKDVVAAKETGVAAGRNERIKEKMRKGKGDGLPMIAGGASPKEKAKDGFLAGTGGKDPWAEARREKY